MRLSVNEKISHPYISFVAVGRNDDYGRNFLGRFQMFLDNLIYLCEKYKLDSELIIIDWNPPKNKSKLCDALKIEKNRKYLQIKFIEIPNKIHKKFINRDNLPLLEYNGKNVGIKNALGDFILITNPDIIFNNKLIQYFSEKRLKKDIVYRIARNDVFGDVPLKVLPSQIEKYCNKNTYRTVGIFYKMHYPIKNTNYFRWFLRSFGTIAKKTLKYLSSPIKNKFLFYIDGMPGDFILMDKKLWFTVKGFGTESSFSYRDNALMFLLFLKKIKLHYFRYPKKIYHQYHQYMGDGNTDFPWDKYLNNSSKFLKDMKGEKNWGLSKTFLKKTSV